MQIVQYVHRTGEALPVHAKVTEVSVATADAVRPTAHGALDALINDIKAGWVPENDAQAAKESADLEVAAAEAALEAAKSKQADAEKKLAAAGSDSSSPAPVAGNGGGGSGGISATTGAAKKGPLPDDFPGVSALRDADLDTYGKVRAYGDVTDVPGIGAATAAKIKAAL
jgi:hypothetical protein